MAGAWDPGSAPFNVHQTGQVRPNGTAFGMEPARGAFPGQEPVTGFQGRRLVNSKNRNLGTLIGELQSEVFTIAGDGIDFLIGGGDFADVTCLTLYVDDAVGLGAGAHRDRRAQPGAGAARLGRGRVPRPAGVPADPGLRPRGAVGLARRAALSGGRLGVHPGGRHPPDGRGRRSAPRRRSRRPRPQLRLRDAAPRTVHRRRLSGGRRCRWRTRDTRPRARWCGGLPVLHRRGRAARSRSVAGVRHLALPRADAERSQAAPHQPVADRGRRRAPYPAPGAAV